MSDVKSELIRICQMMYSKGLLTGADGNLSVRLPDSSWWVTPSGRNKGLIGENDLVRVDSGGQVLQGEGRPSSEFAMHQVAYEVQPECCAVIHCHALFSTVYAATSKNLNRCLLTESVIMLGSVPKAALATPSTSALAEGLRGPLQSSQAVLLANHGLVCTGKTLEDAFSRVETVEHFARISYFAELSGQAEQIPKEQVQQLQALRPQYGLTGPFTPCAVSSPEEKQKDPDLESLKSDLTDAILRIMR